MALPAFYYLLGSTSVHESTECNNEYSLQVARAYSDFSDLNTLTLSCRKIFDHITKKTDLTGANFAKISDECLAEHARYWSGEPGKTEEDCLNALFFLNDFFGEYSKTDTVLLKRDGFLHKRIGLMKQHANHGAAHLSLESHDLDIQDLAHFTAAIVMVGEIIRSFDSPSLGDQYFNDLDAASYQAAKKIFPDIADFRLFKTMEVSDQASFYWKNSKHETVRSYFDQLQWAIG